MPSKHNIQHILKSIISSISRPSPKLIRVMLSLVAMYYLVSFSLFVYRMYVVSNHPYELARGEGLTLNEAISLSKGQSIYLDYNQRPYIAGIYTPLYQFTCSTWIRLTGNISFTFGRVLAGLSMIGIGIIIFLIIREFTKSKLTGLFSSLVFFSFWYIYDYVCIFRVDALGLFFSILGIYWIQKYFRTIKMYWAILFFVLAVYTKQSLVFAPFSVFLFLMLKDKKRALFFTLGMGVCGLSVFFIINAMTGGHFFSNLYLALTAEFVDGKALGWLHMFTVTYPIYILIALFSVKLFIKDKFYVMYLIYFVLSFIPAYSTGKIGAYCNYYSETCFLLSIFCGLTLHTVMKNRSLKQRFIILLLLCVQMNNLTAIEFSGEYLQLSRKPGWTYFPTQTDLDNGKNMFEAVKSLGGLGFSESNVDSFIFSGKEIEYCYFLQDIYPEAWDAQRFHNDLEEGRYSFFISGKDYWDAESIKEFADDRAFKDRADIIKHFYKIKEKIGSHYIYVRI